MEESEEILKAPEEDETTGANESKHVVVELSAEAAASTPDDAVPIFKASPAPAEESKEELESEPREKEELVQMEQEEKRQSVSQQEPAAEEEQKTEHRPEVAKEERRRSSVEQRRGSKRLSGEKTQDIFVPPPQDRRPSPAALHSDTRFASFSRKSKLLSSKAKVALGSVVDIRANVADAYDKKSARYQNTYKLESEKPFNPEKVDKILRDVMEEALDNLHYDPEKCPCQAKWAVGQIRSKVKQLEFDRYKLVCIVSIGEKNSQDVYATCRFLWDPEKDRYATYSLENTHVYGIAYCFGLYYE